MISTTSQSSIIQPTSTGRSDSKREERNQQLGRPLLSCESQTRLKILGEQFFDHMPVNIRETEITPLVAIRQLLMINPQEM